jgi:DNA-binding transcriptional MerR regulator
MYRVQEFADAAGVTVRALHHYDRLALLRPKRTESGYRLYSLRDLERLEQIVALKFLGLPLKDIRAVLDRDGRSLAEMLRAQRHALEEKRRRLDQAIDVIADAERTLRPGVPPDAALLKRIIEVIDMQDNGEHMKQYYTDEAWSALARRHGEMTTEQRHAAAEEGTRAWAALFDDIEASLDEDPTGPKAQALVARWKALVDSFTGGDAGISAGVRKAWADQANWPATLQRQTARFANPKVWAFIETAVAAKRSQA